MQNKINRYAFTLIELLAVLVILAIIALITTTTVLNTINSAKEGAVKNSAYRFIDAIQYYIASTYSDSNSGNNFPLNGLIGSSSTDLLLDIEVKGTKPTSLNEVVLKNGTVYDAIFEIDGHKVVVTSGTVVSSSPIVPTVVTDESCFTFNSGEITNYSDSCTKDVVIPSTIGGVPVTVIGSSAFIYKNLTSLILPNGLITIRNNAFQYNSLKNLSIPNTVTSIGNSAFRGNQIKNLIIPSSVLNIWDDAFSMIEIENILFESGITVIWNGAFFGNQITHLTIPSSIASIRDYSFANNQIKEVIIKKAQGTFVLGGTAFINNGGEGMTPNIIYQP